MQKQQMADLKEASVWLDDLLAGPVLPSQLPRSADVVIIGCGYTGLNAALETARGGRSTLALDSLEDPGAGCSSRNGGQISTSIKPSKEKLAGWFGAERASAMSMASFLGMRLGQKVLGQAEGKTAFDDLPFPHTSIVPRKPLVLPATVAWYRWRDQVQYQRAAAVAG